MESFDPNKEHTILVVSPRVFIPIHSTFQNRYPALCSLPSDRSDSRAHNMAPRFFMILIMLKMSSIPDDHILIHCWLSVQEFVDVRSRGVRGACGDCNSIIQLIGMVPQHP